MAKEENIKLPEYVCRMEDEYKELCEEINSDFFQKLENRIDRLGKFIKENISPEGESINPDKPLTAIQMSYLTMQHQNMVALACNMRAYERVLGLRLDYENFKNSKKGD